MDTVYRLFLKSEEKEDAALEWCFTKRDLDFLEHQYNQGVVSSQPTQTLSLIVGTVREHYGEGLGAMFRGHVPFETLGKVFHGDERDNIRHPFKDYKMEAVRSEDASTTLSVEDGDLLFRLETIGLNGAGDDRQSVAVPFSVIQDIHDMFETSHPGLAGEWHLIESCLMIMTPKLDPLKEYEVTLQKTITLESRVRLSARSRDAASQKAINLSENCQFYENAESKVAATATKPK